MAASALGVVRQRLQVSEQTLPITFLGIAANQTLFNSMVAALVSGAAAALRSSVSLIAEKLTGTIPTD